MMDKAELIEYVRLITWFSPLAVIAAYTLPASVWIRRSLIVLFVAGASASVGIPGGWEVGVLAVLCFALLPLACGVVSQWLDRYIVRRVEKQYGAGSVRLSLQYNTWSMYRLLWDD